MAYKSGVQQGDPLGPLFFSLVLNVLISAITKDSSCPLLFHAWYLDDGALAGPRSSFCRVLTLIRVPPWVFTLASLSGRYSAAMV